MGCCTDHIQDADAENGADLPYLQTQPWQLLRLAAGRNAWEKGLQQDEKSSLRSAFVQNRVSLPAAGGWVREGELRKSFVPKLFWCRHIGFREELKREQGGAVELLPHLPSLQGGPVATSLCSTPGVLCLPAPFPRVPALAGNVISS